MEHFTLNSSARSYPDLPYAKMATDILGKEYTLSLVFVGAKKAAELNKSTRGKLYVPNVLSFPLDETTGEVYIAPAVAKTEASKFKLSYEGYVGFLYIHGLLHLQGHDHGEKMEALEKKYVKKYKLK